MKKDLPSLFVGIALGLLIAWLAGLFKSAALTQQTDAAIVKSAAQIASGAPVTMAPPVVKTVVSVAVASPHAAPAPVMQTPASSPAPAALPAQVAQQSRIKAITNNLRQLSMAAQQYMLDKGVTAASYYDLVDSGTDSYIRSLAPVEGEDYSGIYITQQDTQVMIVAPDGTTVTYNM